MNGIRAALLLLALGTVSPPEVQSGEIYTPGAPSGKTFEGFVTKFLD